MFGLTDKIARLPAPVLFALLTTPQRVHLLLSKEMDIEDRKYLERLIKELQK